MEILKISSLFFVFLLWQLCCVTVQCVSFDQDVSITFEQKQAIDKLKRRVLPRIVEDYMKEDIYLVRWLRATNFDIPRAEHKLLENIRWRKEKNMAEIDKEDFSDIAADYPHSNDGFDKEGRPVLIAFAGEWDLRSAVVTGRIQRVLHYADAQMEQLSRRIRKYQREGKNVTQAILIVELSDFSVVTHACVQCLIRILDFLNSYESHYPGLADKVLFVDAPPAVSFVIELIRQNVSKETRDAIRVYGTNKEQWRKVLLQYIDKKYLPVELGGIVERN